MVAPRWDDGPSALTLVRHAHSVANRADTDAQETGAEELGLLGRDADAELSDTGRSEADGLGVWLASRDRSERPTVVLASPYVRALQTADRAVAVLGLDVVQDERLRERDMGVLHGLTAHGVRRRFPDEAERRARLGELYYQPPSGESWSDVVLRVRSLLADLRVGYTGDRVWLFTHQAVVMAARFVLEGLSEERLLEIEREERLPNAARMTYRRAGDHFEPSGILRPER